MKEKVGVLPFRIEATDDEDVTARAGLPLVVETMRALGLTEKLNEELGIRKRNQGASDGEKSEALVLLMASGGECVSDIQTLIADRGLNRLLGTELPSDDVLLSFLHSFHEEERLEEAKRELGEGKKALLVAASAPLRVLGDAIAFGAGRVAKKMRLKKATLDLDATIIESHKKEATAHYKEGRGYQPVLVAWAEADQVLVDEFRDGNVPAGMGNLPILKRAFSSLPSFVETRFFRADSALYEESCLKWLSNESREGGPKGHIGFSISADMSKELRAACEALPESTWQPLEERAWETVHCAEVEFTPGDWPKNAAPLRYVTVRFTGKQLTIENTFSVKHLAVVTNRLDLSAKELLRWHWEKAGTIEHVHDVIKNELGAGVMPCGRFGANAAWLRFSILTYNVLSAMKQLGLGPGMETARPKRLRFQLFNLPGRIASHAGAMFLKIGRRALELVALLTARSRIAALAFT